MTEKAEITYELVDPIRSPAVTYQAIAELINYSFKDDPMDQWIMGPRYSLEDGWYSKVRQSIIDPRERLAAFLDKAKAQKRIINSAARALSVRALKEGTVIFVAKVDKRIAAVALWDYPPHLRTIDTTLGKSGLRYRLLYIWRKLTQKIGDWWAYLGTENPSDNERHDKFKAAQVNAFFPEVKRADASMNEQELEINPYERKDTVYLSIFAVDPLFQRKGIGKAFLQYTIDQIPNVPTPFEFNGVTKFGPQKIMLNSSLIGLKLYQQVGFKEFTRFQKEVDTIPCAKISMDMTRIDEN